MRDEGTAGVVRRHAIVRGRVQGVSYRAGTAARARELGLAGWVENRADGAVELEVEGAAAAVEALLAWCEHGPPAARVEGVDVSARSPAGRAGGFAIRR